MAHNQKLTISAHPNIYNGNNERTYRIEYSIPQNGTNEDTGIVLIVPGFGANIDSKVYKKIRETFADNYNLVTVQCDYFGSKFMQSSESFSYQQENLEELLSKEDFELLKNDKSNFFKLISNYSTQLNCVATINETQDEFVDMSYMQAIDNITALEAIKIILKENKMLFNDNKIFGYGHSQGAYILHLANKLAPHLFTYIIDNSSWVQPVYLNTNRYLFQQVGNAIISIEFDYLAKTLLKDKESLSLHKIYSSFINGAYIYSLLGTTDNLVTVEDKKMSISKMQFTQFDLIDDNKVDGHIFKSTSHGLDADFLKLFDYVLDKLPTHQNNNKFAEKYTVDGVQTSIIVDYSSALPLFQLV